MDFSKIKKISFILLILFILLFPFWCVRGLCAENVELEHSDNITATTSSNVFTSSTGGLIYFLAETGYKYTIHLNRDITSGRIIVSSSEQPVLNGLYTVIYSYLLNDGDEFLYSPTNNTYISISSSLPDGYVTVTKEPLSNEVNAINSLVDNVGIGAIWNIFDTSINYIVVVVLFAFGAYIIFRIIRKISRGKEGL